MKKLYFLFLLLITGTLSYGQGLENFNNSNATTSYASSFFLGNNNITWTYVASRNENGDANNSNIDGKALMLRRVADGSKITSSLISGGVGNFSVKLYKGFTGAGGRQVELFINGVSKGTSIPFDDYSEHIFTVNNINITGAVTIEIRNTTAYQVIIDDITWTSASTDPTISTISPSNGATFNPETTSKDVTLSVSNFNVANGTGDGHIHWNLNGGTTQMKYDTDPIALTGLTPGNYTVNLELVDNSHQSLIPAKTASVSFTIASYNQVANVAALRAGNVGGDNYYELTGEAVVTYARASRNQKYIQDATAGILIDDNSGVITPAFVIGDGMTGLKGYLGTFSGVLQFVPIVDLQGVSSNNNIITPEVVTVSQLLSGGHESYESELVKIKNLTFTAAGGTFASSTNYDITDATGTMFFRTGFSEADYIGTTIPTLAQDLVVLVAEFSGTPQVYARSLSDLTLDVVKNEITNFSLYPNPVKGGKVFINSANNYAERSVAVFDVLGKQVVAQKGTQNTVDVSHLNKGVYIIKVEEEGKVATRKLVIE